MAGLAPFRALRPAVSAAARVAAVPYDVVNTDEARALAAGNPLSFLHVSRAGDRSSARNRSLTQTRSTRRRSKNFERLKDEAPLVVEDAPRLYVYRLRMGAHAQIGSGRLLFHRRLRARRHPEARAHAARQGRRPHASPARAACADRARCSSPIGAAGDRCDWSNGS